MSTLHIRGKLPNTRAYLLAVSAQQKTTVYNKFHFHKSLKLQRWCFGQTQIIILFIIIIYIDYQRSARTSSSLRPDWLSAKWFATNREDGLVWWPCEYHTLVLSFPHLIMPLSYLIISYHALVLSFPVLSFPWLIFSYLIMLLCDSRLGQWMCWSVLRAAPLLPSLRFHFHLLFPWGFFDLFFCLLEVSLVRFTFIIVLQGFHGVSWLDLCCLHWSPS